MRNLRTYLKKLEKYTPEQLIKVTEPVDWRYEFTARVAEMEKKPDNPALLFTNVKDYSTPLLINLFGHVGRIHHGLGGNTRVTGSRLDFYDDWNRLFSKDVPPINVRNGPVKDIIQKGSNVDLTSLPIPLFYQEDGGRYVTAGLTTARNPEHPEEVNLSYVRMHLQGKDRFGVSLHSRGHMWQYFEKAKALGEPMEIAVIIGAHPSLYLAAAAKITDEYHKAGALQGEPVELVNCETVDIPVPAQAEIVLEGRIELDEEDEGPFTEYTGYISGRSTRNLFKVSAVTMRKDAYFVAVAPSNSAEHLLLSGLPKQARISRAIIDYTHTPALKDIIWPVWATHFVCFISINEAVRGSPGLAKQIALLLLGLDHYVKYVVILPEETDVSDVSEVLHTIATRCDFKYGSDLEALGGVYSQWLDPSSDQPGISSKMIINATGDKIGSGMKVVDSTATLGHGSIMDVSMKSNVEQELCILKIPPDMRDLSELAGLNELGQCRLIVCVDDDIDVHDFREVLWAISTRSQPADDILLKEARMIIDARKGDSWTARRATFKTK